MLSNYILALLKYMLKLLKNKLVLIKINLYFDKNNFYINNTILYFNNSQLACFEIIIHVFSSLSITLFSRNFITCIFTRRIVNMIDLTTGEAVVETQVIAVETQVVFCRNTS